MRNDQLLLQDIAEAGQRINRYVSGLTYEAFMDNELVKDAVVRNFEIIGEAAGRLSEAIQQSRPTIEWRKMKAFRNLLIHQYFGVEYSLVWDIIQTTLPNMLAGLQQIDSNKP